MRIVLIGGPLDGAERDVTQRPPDYVWVQPGGGYPRFFRQKKPGRLLYRYDHGTKRKGEWDHFFLWSDLTVALCGACDVFHRREADTTSCQFCGGPLQVVG
jgi:hypothetical protein